MKERGITGRKCPDCGAYFRIIEYADGHIDIICQCDEKITVVYEDRPLPLYVDDDE